MSLLRVLQRGCDRPARRSRSLHPPACWPARRRSACGSPRRQPDRASVPDNPAPAAGDRQCAAQRQRQLERLVRGTIGGRADAARPPGSTGHKASGMSVHSMDEQRLRVGTGARGARLTTHRRWCRRSSSPSRASAIVLSVSLTSPVENPDVAAPTTFCTKAVVAIDVSLSPGVGVGAVGVPMKIGTVDRRTGGVESGGCDPRAHISARRRPRQVPSMTGAAVADLPDDKGGGGNARCRCH